MRVLSEPRPEYVDQCVGCGSAFFHFGDRNTVSHNDMYQDAGQYSAYLDATNTASMTARNGEALKRLRDSLRRVESPTLFDIGAGSGEFLALAREEGFDVAGNEISAPAIEACRKRHGIELVLGDDLEAIAETSPKYDAVTMWCVIAHVDDPRQLLQGIRKLLRSGGVLFLTTPRYCLIDRFAYLLVRAFGDRFRRIFDRRINESHRRQYSVRGLEALLRSEGFAPISVEPSIGYGLQMRSYLSAIGVPPLFAGPTGKVLTFLARAGLAPRNVLNVYAEAT